MSDKYNDHWRMTKDLSVLPTWGEGTVLSLSACLSVFVRADFAAVIIELKTKYSVTVEFWQAMDYASQWGQQGSQTSQTIFL